MRTLRISVVAMLAVLGTTMPAGAISGGTVDGTAHPYVACLVGRFPDGITGCATGALISPTVVLTAGHVTAFFQDSGANVGVSFDPQVTEKTKFLSVDRVVTSPDFDPNSLFYDYGVVVLSRPVRGITPMKLPTAGLVDELRQSRQLDELQVVGYGCAVDLSGTGPGDFSCDQTRRSAIEDVTAVDGGDGIEIQLRSGGVCAGDSGAPHLIPGTDTSVGVQDGGVGRCRGIAFAWRIDTPIARSFLEDFVQLP